MLALLSVLVVVFGLVALVRAAERPRFGRLVLLGGVLLVLGAMIAGRSVSRVEMDAAQRATAADTAGKTADASATAADKDTADKDTAADDAAADDDPALAIPVGGEPAGVVIPPRPAWLDAEPVLVGEKQTRKVCSGPFERLGECRRELDVQLARAVAEYIDEYYGLDDRGLKASDVVRYDLGYIKSHLVRPDHIYHEVVRVSVGPMHQLHALVEFDGAFRQTLDERRGEVERQVRAQAAAARLAPTGIGFGLVLAALGIAYVLLRFGPRREPALAQANGGR